MNNVIPHPSTLKTVSTTITASGKQIQIVDAEPIFNLIFNGVDYKSESWATSSQMFINWCQAYNVCYCYYGRPKVEFDMNEAIRLAEKKNCSYLIVEDLS